MVYRVYVEKKLPFAAEAKDIRVVVKPRVLRAVMVRNTGRSYSLYLIGS